MTSPTLTTLYAQLNQEQAILQGMAEDFSYGSEQRFQSQIAYIKAIQDQAIAAESDSELSAANTRKRYERIYRLIRRWLGFYDGDKASKNEYRRIALYMRLNPCGDDVIAERAFMSWEAARSVHIRADYTEVLALRRGYVLNELDLDSPYNWEDDAY